MKGSNILIVCVSMFVCFMLLPPSSLAWWADSWLYARNITFLNAGNGALTDFTIPVYLTNTEVAYGTKTEAGGVDVRFVDSDNTELNYSLEIWNTTETSVFWVRVPQIDANSSTDYITMYYGNSGVGAGNASVNDAGTWDDNYKMVYYFNESTNTHYDVKGGVTGTESAAMQRQMSGVVAGASALHLDNNEDFVDTNTDTNMHDYTGGTMEIWIMNTSHCDTLGNAKVMYALSAKNVNSASLLVSNNWSPVCKGDGAYPAMVFADAAGVNDEGACSNIQIDGDDWNYITGTWGTEIAIYLNATEVGTHAYAGKTYSQGEDMQFGFTGTVDIDSPIIIDHARVSDVERTPDYINVTYTSILGNFVVIGGEVSIAPAEVVELNLTINGTQGNMSLDVGTWVNFTVIANVTGNISLDCDYPFFTTQTNTTPLTNYTYLDTIGTDFNVTGYFEGNASYLPQNETWWLNVTVPSVAPTVEAAVDYGIVITFITDKFQNIMVR